MKLKKRSLYEIPLGRMKLDRRKGFCLEVHDRRAKSRVPCKRPVLGFGAR